MLCPRHTENRAVLWGRDGACFDGPRISDTLGDTEDDPKEDGREARAP